MPTHTRHRGSGADRPVSYRMTTATGHSQVPNQVEAAGQLPRQSQGPSTLRRSFVTRFVTPRPSHGPELKKEQRSQFN